MRVSPEWSAGRQPGSSAPLPCLLAIDLGTTTCRCLACDVKGHPLAQASRELSLCCAQIAGRPRSQGTHAEADPLEWWAATQEVVHQVMDVLGGRFIRPLGIGFTGLMHAMVPLDEHGQPLSRAMLWMDQRCQPQVDELNARERETLERVYGPHAQVTATPSLPKLRWLAENAPELVGRTRCFLLSKDYVRYRLTGVLATDPSDAGGAMLHDPRSGDWSPELVRLAGIRREQLPPILPSTAVVGHITAEAARLTGLPAGLPAVVGAGDVQATVRGMGGEVPDQLQVYLGTAAWLRLQRSDGTSRMRATATTGAALRWLRDLLAPVPQEASGSYKGLTAEAAQVSPGAEGLLFLPHLCGERAPYYRADVRGSLLGLNLIHGRAHLVRAVLEGCALHLRWLLDDPTKPPPQRAVSAGGGAQSPLWLQILADVLNVPISIPQVVEAGAMGAAILAAVGVGVYPDEEAAISRMVHLGEACRPDAERVALYDEMYERFLQAERATASLREQAH